MDGLESVLGGVVAYDIETVPRTAPEALPPMTRARLDRAVARELPPGADAEARAEAYAKVMGTHPLLARVVAIGFVRDAPPGRTALVVTERPLRERDVVAVDEPELLRAFWRVAASCERLVGYASRGFDLPVLLTRSAVHGIAASIDLAADPLDRHVDLQTVLSRDGARRRVGGLELACDTFGIPTPKAVASGADVPGLYRDGDHDRIGAYVLADVTATLELYRRLRGTWIL